MCMSNYFLMYVIPSVMVQSYICYVTKPVVKVELSKFCSRAHIWRWIAQISMSYFPFCNQMSKGRQWKGNKGKVKVFDGPKAAKKDGMSDPEVFETLFPSTGYLETRNIKNRRLLPQSL